MNDIDSKPQNYAHAIGPALNEFLAEHGDALAVGGGDNGSDLKKAVETLTKSAEVINASYSS